MAGFCCFGATGTLTIDGVALNGPAWDVPNLARLWMEGANRGENKALPNLALGRRGNPHRVDAFEIDLAFAITGDSDPAGAATLDSWVGLVANLDALWAGVFAPVTVGRGTRPATLLMPSGAVRVADVQVEPLRFPNDIDDPGFVESVIHMTVVSGRFT